MGEAGLFSGLNKETAAAAVYGDEEKYTPSTEATAFYSFRPRSHDVAASINLLAMMCVCDRPIYSGASVHGICFTIQPGSHGFAGDDHDTWQPFCYNLFDAQWMTIAQQTQRQRT